MFVFNFSHLYLFFCIILGGEDNLALQIESILEFCNDECPQTRDRTYNHLKDQDSTQPVKRKRLSEAIFSIQKSCQASSGIRVLAFQLHIILFLGNFKCY